MLVLALALALPQNPITLPPRQQPPPAAPTPAARAADFATDAQALRRSQMRSAAREDEILAELSQRYPDFAARAAALLRTADADLAQGLLRVLERFGTAEDAALVESLLLSRPLGPATAQAVQTMVALRGEEAKEALLRCLTTKVAGARREVAQALRPRLGPDDATRLLELEKGAGIDLRATIVFLLGAIPTPPARAHLVGVLSAPDMSLAAAAGDALVEHGPAGAPDLQALLGRAAVDRAFGHAAVALARLELKHGVELLAEPMVPLLVQELDSHDPFMRVAAAIGLAQLAYRSTDVEGARYADRQVVEGLLLVVAPGTFVPGYSLLQPVARETLRRFAGRELTAVGDWQAWWQGAREGFVGMRRAVGVDARNGAMAMLLQRVPGRTVRVRGEGTAPAALESGGEDYVLSGDEMVELVRRLREAGFMREQTPAAPTGVPLVRSLELRVGSAQARCDAPERGEPWMDRFVAELDAIAGRERWQLYPDPAAGDFAAFWRRERAWLLANAERRARDGRCKDLIVAALPRLQGAERARAIDHLNEIPQLGALLTEADGLALVAAVARADRIDAASERLLAIASRVESDRVWREALAAVDALHAKGGKEALPRLFGLLGVDRVIEALLDPRPNIALAAMLEVAEVKELRAVPALLSALRAGDEQVRETATYALGVLRAEAARQPLIEALPSLPPPARRVAWMALGRIGGEGVLALLMQATTHESAEDKRAAIAALGKLEDAGAAEYLASLFVAAGPGPLGNMALQALHEQGALRARVALRRALQQSRDEQVRADIVQVLAGFQDPTVVPQLLDLLDHPREAGRAALQLAAITGVDVVNLPDRKAAMRQWWARNQGRSQAEWFLAGAREAGMTTLLEARQLQPGAGVEAVPELTRLLTAAERPHLRQLALALLRDTTQRDFGSLPPQESAEALVALADRYRFYAEAMTGPGKR